MKVKDLLEELKKLDENKEVLIKETVTGWFFNLSSSIKETSEYVVLIGDVGYGIENDLLEEEYDRKC